MSSIPFQIALDGPAGAGKSTVARLVAGKLGFTYVDTGAMYRAVTWKVLQAGIDPADESTISGLVESLQMDLTPTEEGQMVALNGEDVTSFLRTPQVTANVSQVSRVEAVRIRLIEWQRELSLSRDVVMDGRDIGTRVLPDAPVKVFLTATAEARANRRWLEQKDKFPDVTVDQLVQELQERDRLDETRKSSPLVCASDAVRIDSSDLTVAEVVDKIVALCESKRKELGVS